MSDTSSHCPGQELDSKQHVAGSDRYRTTDMQKTPEMAEHKKTLNHKADKDSAVSKRHRASLSPGQRAFIQTRTPRCHPSAATPRQFTFTYDDLYNCLYRHNNVQTINVECSKKHCVKKEGSAACEMCRSKTIAECPVHAGSLPPQNKATAGHKELKVTYAITSFPNEVQLCTSSIPGEGRGVCAKQHIPVGTWIGPYEGRRVVPDDVTPVMNTSYMWEIFQEGSLVYYIDASDENTSSWMRFIRCARFKEEQNLFAFQYCGNIYYRAFRDIPVGTELLVWYDEKYPLFMGLPINVQDMAIIDPTGSKLLQEMLTTHMRAQAAPQNLPTSSTQNSAPLPMHVHAPTPAHTPTTATQPRTRSRTTTDKTYPIQQQDQLTITDTRIVQSGVHTTPRKRLKTSPTPNNFATTSGRVAYPERFGEINLPFKDCNRDCKNDEDRSFPELPDEPEMGLWNCGQCNRSFTQRSMLQIHICPRMSKRPYKCGHCSDSFSHSSELRTHVVTHTNEKPFKCGYCSRSFAGSTTLNNHIRSHTGERPFTCEKCNRTFNQATQLSRHMRTPEECLV